MNEPGRRAGRANLNAPEGTTHLHVRTAAPAPRDAAKIALGAGRGAWLGTRLDAPESGGDSQRYALDLEMPLGDGASPISLRKAAVVDVGPLTEEVVGGPMCALVSWRAASLAPLFPVFSGSLCWSDGELDIDGYYAPPGGRVGIAADRIIMRLVAERTARWLLGRAIHAMNVR